MTWLRIDDEFPEHEKVMRLKGAAAKWLHLVALCQCASNLTDGHIDRQRLKVICAIADVPRPAHCVQQLVEVGLWIADGEGGYRVKDYLDYNPDAASVKAKRVARQQAGRLGGLASGEARREANAEANASRLVEPQTQTQALPVSVNPTEPVGHIHDFEALKAAAKLLEAIPHDGRDSGTEAVVLAAARTLDAATLDGIRVSLERKLGEDSLFKAAGAYVNGAIQKALRKAAA